MSVVFCWPMETKVIKIDGSQINSAGIAEAAAIIDVGGLVALCMPEVPVEKRENDELD